MNSDFSKAQRQSLIGVLLMFINTLQKAARALFPVLLVWLFQINKVNKLYLTLGAVIVFILLAGIAYLRYLNFTFYIDEDNEEFIIREGIWNKSRLAIPLNKIQQVNINQSLLQRIIGVHALEVDTAGSSDKEVSIKAISQDLAIALKARLIESERRQNIGSDTYEEEEIADKPVFIKISFMSLVKTGITSNYVRTIGLLLAFVITTFQHIDEFITYSGYRDDALDRYISFEMVLRFIAVIVIGVIILVLVINLSRTILRFFNYKITKQRDSLLLSYGLVATKNTILRPNKVQIVTVGRNYFQKKLNIQDIKVRQASNREANDQQAKKTAIEIPGCNEGEKDLLLEFLLEQLPKKGEVVKPNIRKVIFPSFMFLIIPVSLYFSFANTIAPELYDALLFVPFYIVSVVLLIYFNFRHNRLYVSNDFIIKRSGAWDIDNEYIAPHKIQTISLSQMFWQKYSDVGTVSLHTAGGTVSFGLANYTRLKELVNVWLYKVETTGKHWM
jgi:putative membrane protein